MSKLLTVGEVAERFGVEPRLITNLIYTRKLAAENYPLFGNRRVIPESRLEEVEAAIRKHQERQAEAANA